MLQERNALEAAGLNNTHGGILINIYICLLSVKPSPVPPLTPPPPPIANSAKTLKENVFFHYDWQVRFVVDLGVFLSALSALLRRSGTGALLWHPSLSHPRLSLRFQTFVGALDVGEFLITPWQKALTKMTWDPARK
ncbi:uncharacterized protein LOC120451880 [Drosophila santomea]|uniref:uncharacterized protein LOC120451880 n=1 Tax=Drosophila santomea TaxID=129105 RepID=UPI001954E2E5|nr:uncharacterized protein LOC120451880 [Drosophila santomea]